MSPPILRGQEMYAPLRLPAALVVGVGTGNGRQDYLFKVVDTSSTLIWMQCKGCDPHSPQRHQLFDTTASPTFRLVPGTDSFCRTPYPYWSELSGHACAFRVDGPSGRPADLQHAHECIRTSPQGLSFPERQCVRRRDWRDGRGSWADSRTASSMAAKRTAAVPNIQFSAAVRTPCILAIRFRLDIHSWIATWIVCSSDYKVN